MIPTGIFSGNILELPPVTMVSPFLTDANLGISISCTYPAFLAFHIKEPKWLDFLTLALIFDFTLRHLGLLHI